MEEKEEKLTPSLILKMFAETNKRIEKDWQKIKEMFAESKIEADKRNAEADRRAAERTAESEKEWEEIRKQMKEVRKEIGGIGYSNGKMAEDMIYNALNRDKTFAGIKFYDIERNVKFKSKKLNLDGEFDVVLENGDTIGIIETKYKVEKDNITDLVEKKTINFRKLFPMFSDYKIILGIGGMSFEEDAITTAKEKGIGIIKILGDKLEYYTDGIKIY